MIVGLVCDKLFNFHSTIINFSFKVYFAGPVLGGIAGSVIYMQIFSAMKPAEFETYRQVQRLEEIELTQK
jgi:hypothetical protein